MGFFLCPPKTSGIYSGKSPHVWKTVRTTLQSNIGLRLRGKGQEMGENGVENFRSYILTHNCLQIVGRLFYNVRKFHEPRIS